MLSVAKHLLFLIENKQKQIPRADLQQSLQVEIGSALRSGRHRRGLFISLLA
jgi:hypothetical protein